MESEPSLPPLTERLEKISQKIQKLALKIIKFQKVQKDSTKYTFQQYYFFKEEIMELIAEMSSEIEDMLPVQERLHSLDARLIIDSFNEQIEKMQRITLEEGDDLTFKETPMAIIKNEVIETKNPE